MRRIPFILGSALLLVSAQAYSQPCGAQQTVHLHLQIEGRNIQGESPILSMDRAGTIEVLTYSDGGNRYRSGDLEDGTFILAELAHEPIVFTKPIDKTSPLLWKALDRNEPVSGEFRFYRPDPGGTGAEQHFYTVRIEDAHVASITAISRDRHDLLGEQFYPVYEEVAFVYLTITRTYEIGGATYQSRVRR